MLSEKIFEQALDLPVNDRLTLIDKLLSSTNLPTQEKVDQAWAKEVELRYQAIDSGKARLIPGEEVFKKNKGRKKTNYTKWHQELFEDMDLEELATKADSYSKSLS